MVISLNSNLLVSLVALFGAPILGSAAPFNDAFADKRVAAYVQNASSLYEDSALVEIPGMTGKRCLALTYDNEVDAEFMPVPVSASTAYAFSFRGQWENSETLDNNPTFEAAVGESWRAALVYVPTLNLVFSDAEEKPIKEGGVFLAMPYGKWHDYRLVFFTPPRAAFMKLQARSGRNTGTFYFDNIKFEPVKSAPVETVLHFGVSSPEICGSFYGFILPTSLRVGSNGRHLVSSGYGGVSSLINLAGPGRYRLSFKGDVLRTHGMVSFGVQFIDGNGKKVGEAQSSKLDAEPLEFTLPEHSNGIKLGIYNHLIDEIKITKLNP